MAKITINDAINYFDEQVPNQFSTEDKIKWLSNLDQIIFDHIIEPRSKEPITFDGYTLDTPQSTELIVPTPFTDIYRYWLEQNVDFANREISSYNNAAMMYQSYYDEFFAYYNRRHRTVKQYQVKVEG